MGSLWTKVKTMAISFNLFNNETTDENILRCQRLATRLFILLFLISSMILLIYTALSDQIITDTIKFPNQAIIEHLQVLYPDTLNCPCSQIATPYNKLVNDNITYHEICSSQFVTEEWIKQSYRANVTYIWPLDIRSISSAFSQILHSFCLLSNMTIRNALMSFGSQSMITTKALSSLQFNIQARSLAESIRNAASINLHLTTTVTGGIMSGNQLVSGLGTNMLGELQQTSTAYQMANRATIYGGVPYIGGGCLCSVAASCTLLAGLFLDVKYTGQYRFSYEMYNGSKPATRIPGLKGGCYPVESLLQSTLECFYNSSCLSLLVSTDKIPPALDINKQKRSISTTVGSLVRELFIDSWNSVVFYERYIQECAPRMCTYSYTRPTNFIEIITTLFGLMGGLSFGLKFFVGQIILRLLIFFVKRKRRQNVRPCDDNLENVVNNPEQGKAFERSLDD